MTICECSQKVFCFSDVFIVSLEGFGLFDILVVIVIVIGCVIVNSIWSSILAKGSQGNVVNVDEPVTQWFCRRRVFGGSITWFDTLSARMF